MKFPAYRRFPRFLSAALCAALLLLSPGPQAAQAAADALRSNGGTRNTQSAPPPALNLNTDPSLNPTANSLLVPAPMSPAPSMPSPQAQDASAKPLSNPSDTLTSTPEAALTVVSRGSIVRKQRGSEKTLVPASSAGSPLQALKGETASLNQAPSWMSRFGLLGKMFSGSNYRDQDNSSVSGAYSRPFGKPLLTPAPTKSASEIRTRAIPLPEAHAPANLWAANLLPLAAFIGTASLASIGLPILSASLGAGVGWYLARQDKPAFLHKSGLAQGLVAVSSGVLLWFSLGLPALYAAPLIASASFGAALAATFLSKRIVTAYHEVKKSLAWFRGFWKQMNSAGMSINKEMTVASLLALLSTAISFVPPVFLGQVVKNLGALGTAAANPSSLPWYQAIFAVPVLFTYLKLGLFLLGAYAIGAVVQYSFSRQMYTIGNKMMFNLNALFGGHVVNLPMTWHNVSETGDVISTASDGIYNVQRTSTDVIINTIKNGALALGAFIGMLWVNWPLTLMIAPFLVIALSIPTSIYNAATKQAYKWFFSKLKPKLASLLAQIVGNIEFIKATGQQEREIAAIQELGRKTYIEGGGKIAAAAAPNQTLMNALTDASRVVVILVVVMAVYLGAMSISSATIYFLVSNYFREGVQQLYTTFNQIKQMEGAASKYDRIMKQVEENYNQTGAVLPPSMHGRGIRFDNVSFGYRPGQNVLNGVNLEIKPGQMVALVGESGSGKTTIARLMLGLYPIQGGKISIDGRDLKELNATTLRRRVGVLLQESIPFNTSVLDNIRYLKPQASEQEIWRASQEAGLHDDIIHIGYNRNLKASGDEEDAAEAKLVSNIKSGIAAARNILGQSPNAEISQDKSILDNIRGQSGASFEQVMEAAQKAGIHDDIVRLGYSAKVGERGVTLSGGQKQRLMIARLFVSDGEPWDIMILDEPTAALDGVTQKRIQDAIEKRRGRATILVVAHRLSTIQDADQIVVFNRGKIIEQGSHNELIQKHGAYSKLWEAQRLIAEATDEASR